jgi:hypothetical protein
MKRTGGSLQHSVLEFGATKRRFCGWEYGIRGTHVLESEQDAYITIVTVEQGI